MLVDPKSGASLGHAMRARASNPWDATKGGKQTHAPLPRQPAKFRLDAEVTIRADRFRARLRTPRNAAEALALSKWANVLKCEKENRRRR